MATKPPPPPATMDNTPSSSSSPPPSDNINYFSQHPHDSWDLIEYLEWCRQLGEYEHDIALSRWVRSLETIANDTTESEERRARAQVLRDKYRRRNEKDRARRWLDPQNSNTGGKDGKPPKITIYKNKGPFFNAINAGSDVHIGHIENSKASKRPLESAIEGGKTGRAADAKRPKSKGSPSDFIDGTSLDEAVELFESIYNNDVDDWIVNTIFSGVSKRPSWLTKDSPILSGIIDLNDSQVTEWFDGKLDVLRGLVKPLPSPDKHFAHSVNRFAKAKTAEDYQTILDTVPCRPPEEPYDRKKHFDAGWVNFVIQAMLALFGSYGTLASCFNFREGWFDSNIWSPLIDHCLLGLDGVVVQRKEIKCFALKLIGNNNLRYDAIIHTARDFAPIEYAAIEVSRSIENDESLPAKKYVSDSTKLVTGMHSMLRRLHALVDNDEETIKQLQVVGMLNEGLNMQILRMTSLPHGVFLLSRGTVRSVPTCIGELGSIFQLMNSIGMFKAIIRETIAAIADYKAKKAAENHVGGDLYQQLMGQNEL